MNIYNVERSLNDRDLARRTSQLIASQIYLILEQKERAQIALSGGSTPVESYYLLSKEHLPWERVDLFLGDERWVAYEDKASNAAMIHRTLLSSGPSASCKFHPIPTVQCKNPQESANKFATLLDTICTGQPPILDLILLGLGDDGHTASLFPGSDCLSVTDSWACTSNAKGHDRVTMTAPVLSSSKKIIFLVSGSSKQIALKRLLDPDESFNRTPAKLVKSDSEILILTDKDAFP